VTRRSLLGFYGSWGGVRRRMEDSLVDDCVTKNDSGGYPGRFKGGPPGLETYAIVIQKSPARRPVRMGSG